MFSFSSKEPDVVWLLWLHLDCSARCTLTYTWCCFEQQRLTAHVPVCRDVELPAGDAAETLRRGTQRGQHPHWTHLWLQLRRPPWHHREDKRVRVKGQPLDCVCFTMSSTAGQKDGWNIQFIWPQRHKSQVQKSIWISLDLLRKENVDPAVSLLLKQLNTSSNNECIREATDAASLIKNQAEYHGDKSSWCTSILLFFFFLVVFESVLSGVSCVRHIHTDVYYRSITVLHHQAPGCWLRPPSCVQVLTWRTTRPHPLLHGCDELSGAEPDFGGVWWRAQGLLLPAPPQTRQQRSLQCEFKQQPTGGSAVPAVTAAVTAAGRESMTGGGGMESN